MRIANGFTIGGFMDGTKRCPQCHRVPDLRIEKDGMYWLICAAHGHEAVGNDLRSAIKNWNLYIQGVTSDFVTSVMTKEGGLDRSYCWLCHKMTPSHVSLGEESRIRCLFCKILKYVGHLEVIL